MAQVISAYAGRNGEGQKILGGLYRVGQVIPGDVWTRVPPGNRRAMLNMKRVEEDRIVVKAPTRKRRKRTRKRAA